jgi:hypothetical protein
VRCGAVRCGAVRVCVRSRGIRDPSRVWIGRSRANRALGGEESCLHTSLLEDFDDRCTLAVQLGLALQPPHRPLLRKARHATTGCPFSADLRFVLTHSVQRLCSLHGNAARREPVACWVVPTRAAAGAQQRAGKRAEPVDFTRKSTGPN